MCPGGSARGGGREGLPVVFGDPPAHGEAGPGAELWQGKVSGFAKLGKVGKNLSGKLLFSLRVISRLSALSLWSPSSHTNDSAHYCP